MKIKICGLRREEDIAYANEVKPDYVGFILSAGFRRSISMETARQLKDKLDPGILAVGVFVDDEPEKIAEYLQENVIDVAQLHGRESEEDICYIKAVTGKPVIKVLKMSEDPQMNRLMIEAWLDSAADYLLFDSGMGSGKTFDWKLLDELMQDAGGELPKPFFMAGGLTADNLREVAGRWRPYAADLSSSVETDGVKDLEKMRKAVSAVRELGKRKE